MFEYYTTKAWDFNVDYFLSMRRKLNNKEKKIFKVTKNYIYFIYEYYI